MKKIANCLVLRDTFSTDTTLGKWYINGEYFSFTLEDAVRGYGIKIDGHTALPEGDYRIVLSMSSRFKRIMPMIYTEDNQYEVVKGGIRFKGVRAHGGNKHEDTHACILVAKNKVDDRHIQGSMEAELTEKLKGYDEIYLTIKNS